MDFPVRGEIIGADFNGEVTGQGNEGRCIIWVEVPPDTLVSAARVVLLNADDYERSLPVADDVLGILS